MDRPSCSLALVLALAALSAAALGWPSLRAQAGRAPSRTPASEGQPGVTGTWRLGQVELLGATVERVPAPAAPAFGSSDPVGLMVHGPGGHFGVTIMQRARRPYAGPQPTPEEAKAAFDGFVAYFGTYAATPSALTHRVEGGLNPNDAGAERRFTIEHAGERLSMTGPWGHAGQRARLLWDRVPVVANPTATHKRIAGFWTRAGRERKLPDGSLFDSEKGKQSGYLIFTPSGYMAVHGMDPGRPKLAGAEATPAEAKRSIETYGSAYFGPYTVYESESLEVTKQIGLIPPGQVGNDARRHYEFRSGDHLILKPPAETIKGQALQPFVHWARVPGESW